MSPFEDFYGTGFDEWAGSIEQLERYFDRPDRQVDWHPSLDDRSGHD
jgi:hypothetical protein